MKSMYEITRPIIAQVSIDGNLEIPIGYAYDLYKTDIFGKFSPTDIVQQWQEFVKTAEHDRFVNDYLDQIMNRGWLRIDALTPQFWNRFKNSNFHTTLNQQQSSSLTDQLFEALITSGNVAAAPQNDHLYSVVSWYGFVVQLVHALDDITETFDGADIDFFCAVVYDVLEILTWRDHVVAKLND